MKLLKEFVLLSEDIFRDNLRDMARMASEIHAVRYSAEGDEQTPWSELLANPSRDKKLTRDISQATALHTNKVVKVLGSGYEAIAFLLDNGKVIKLGRLHHGEKIFHDGSSEQQVHIPQKYKTKLSKKIVGKNTENDVNLFDVGRAHAVMEELMPFEKWIYTQPKGVRFRYISVYGDIRWTFREIKKLRIDNEKKEKLMMKACKKIYEETGLEFIYRIAIAFANEFDNPSSDLNAGNLGVRGDPNDPTFVFFDF